MINWVLAFGVVCLGTSLFLTWRERRRTLIANPRPDREDWSYRRLLAERH